MYEHESLETVKWFRRIDKLREETQTTIDEMAFLCGVTPLAYKNWRSHNTTPRVDRLQRFKELIEHFENEANRAAQIAKNKRRKESHQKLATKLRLKTVKKRKMQEKTHAKNT